MPRKFRVTLHHQNYLVYYSIMYYKKAIRIISKATYRDHRDPLFVQFNCLKLLHDIIDLKTLPIVFKAFSRLDVRACDLVWDAWAPLRLDVRVCDLVWDAWAPLRLDVRV